MELGDNTFSLEELEALFEEESAPATPPVEEGTEPPASQPTEDDKKSDSIESTKAFAKRLSEMRNKERETIAKSMGFDSYELMMKDRESKLLEDKGLDPEQVSPIVEQLVKQRIDNDPRMRELETLRKKQIEEFGKKELAEITKLTGGEVTKLEQLPKEVLELWKTKGSLKAAFIQVKGEELIMKAQSGSSKGTTSHLQTPNGTKTPSTGERPLTDEEKRRYRFFNPGISDEELNKKTTKF